MVLCQSQSRQHSEDPRRCPPRSYATRRSFLGKAVTVAALQSLVNRTQTQYRSARQANRLLQAAFCVNALRQHSSSSIELSLAILPRSNAAVFLEPANKPVTFASTEALVRDASFRSSGTCLSSLQRGSHSQKSLQRDTGDLFCDSGLTDESQVSYHSTVPILTHHHGVDTRFGSMVAARPELRAVRRISRCLRSMSLY